MFLDAALNDVAQALGQINTPDSTTAVKQAAAELVMGDEALKNAALLFAYEANGGELAAV